MEAPAPARPGSGALELCRLGLEPLGEALSRGQMRWRLASGLHADCGAIALVVQSTGLRGGVGIPLPALGSAITCFLEYLSHWTIVVSDLSTFVDIPALINIYCLSLPNWGQAWAG